MSDFVTLSTPAGSARLRRTNRTTLAISVLPDGLLELVAPQECTESEIVARVIRRRRWIMRQRLEFADMHRNRMPLRFESGATHRYLGRQYRLKVQRGRPVRVRLVGAFLEVTTAEGNPTEVEVALTQWLRRKALEQFQARLTKWEEWCRDRHLPAPRVLLRQMSKRWGSAHPDGRIYLNPDLVKAPSLCIDYVIAHEVCHLRHPRHDSRFYSLLDQVFPNWAKTKARLEQLP